MTAAPSYFENRTVTVTGVDTTAWGIPSCPLECDVSEAAPGPLGNRDALDWPQAGHRASGR